MLRLCVDPARAVGQPFVVLLQESRFRVEADKPAQLQDADVPAALNASTLQQAAPPLHRPNHKLGNAVPRWAVKAPAPPHPHGDDQAGVYPCGVEP